MGSGSIASNKTAFLEFGHVTVVGLFSKLTMDTAVADAMEWFEERELSLTSDEKLLMLEPAGSHLPRKLENPFVWRPLFERLGTDAQLLNVVTGLIGRPTRVLFSQIFFKPPGGSAKPLHQDGFYFRPRDPSRFVTAWIALEDATPANGCLLYAQRSHLGDILEHTAPRSQPHHLRVPRGATARYEVVPEPVPAGGVSFHHGNMIHGSLPNRSRTRWRRSFVVHFSSE
ncbi:phytanoyl-CoA dioxygenase family protein [Paraburkholderia mimosarum]|uniref:phytanoyl-CoA dioxygenase family protein n=1 Tax=Paraburkholderia mimosarum TaxID=312026 RepID=UPI00047FACED|nr:phytanoyl-CoA dioxygenase family protein [Paraburkholderia mimosarum]